ncbi:hypothetical protein SLNSH_02675 [Alsobacter soli]|uniref:Uncharacterized protein n=1 Tax=Alsobacter soli TaxID=2109933 RepID=A0A2T1HYR1_9HYPH|nr:hypothetical protein [Alsobacter soli]PSC06718.1 hypothetical protein SLNSH_02675 [Alsobacter soli]
MLHKRYRELAERCLQRVNLMEDDGDKAMLLRMAQTWLRLARREEQGDGGHRVPDAEGLPTVLHDPEKR